MPGTVENGAALSVNFDNPYDVTVDIANNIYVADYSNHCVRKITSTTSPVVSTVAGVMNWDGNNDGMVGTARLTYPRAVAVNNTNNMVFTVEYTISRLRYISNNTVTTLLNGDPPANYGLNTPIGVVYSEKRNPDFPILIADRANNRIVEVNMNRIAHAPQIILPFQPHDLEADDAGNIIVLDRTGRLVAVVYKDNTVQYIAGTGINYDLQNPTGLAIDTKNKIIYISDGVYSIVMAKYQ
jgi:NHL repeat